METLISRSPSRALGPLTLPAHQPSTATANLQRRAQLLTLDQRDTAAWQVANRLRAHLAAKVPAPAVIALYLPQGSVVDLLKLAPDLRAQGYALCLPRVVYPGHAMVFNLWEDAAPLDEDSTGRACAGGAEVTPALWVLPLAGYGQGGLGLLPGNALLAQSVRQTLATAPWQFATVGITYTELHSEPMPGLNPLRLETLITGSEIIYTV